VDRHRRWRLAIDTRSRRGSPAAIFCETHRATSPATTGSSIVRRPLRARPRSTPLTPKDSAFILIPVPFRFPSPFPFPLQIQIPFASSVPPRSDSGRRSRRRSSRRSSRRFGLNFRLHPRSGLISFPATGPIPTSDPDSIRIFSPTPCRFRSPLQSPLRPQLPLAPSFRSHFIPRHRSHPRSPLSLPPPNCFYLSRVSRTVAFVPLPAPSI